jgi:hypothetical protein
VYDYDLDKDLREKNDIRGFEDIGNMKLPYPGQRLEGMNDYIGSQCSQQL